MSDSASGTWKRAGNSIWRRWRRSASAWRWRAAYGVGLGRGGKPQLWLSQGEPPVSPLHIAFAARNRAEVDAFHAAALAAGGKDNGAPGLRPHYHPNYYGAFAIDPDGHNIEAVCHSAAP